jgi:arsenate reductase-like glutaredoxin family protein
MSEVMIYQYADCGTSRKTLALMRAAHILSLAIADYRYQALALSY